MTTTRLAVCRISDVPPGEMKGFIIDGRAVLVMNVGGRFVACNGICPHQDVPLCNGLFDGEVLTCTQHLWQWAAVDGEPLGAAEMPLDIYRTEVVGETVYAEVE